MPLTEQELHNLAMNIVGEALQELGWEFLLVNSDRKKDPQFVCIDPQGQKSFIIVRPILQGDDPDVYDPVLMEAVRRKAQEHKGDAYWAGVGLYDVANPLAPLEHGKSYQVDFRGLLKIE